MDSRKILLLLTLIMILIENSYQTVVKPSIFNSKTVIAMIGDSDTRGSFEMKSKVNYPTYLQKLLGSKKYQVLNFAAGGAAVMKNFKNSYSNKYEHSQSLKSNPDSVFLEFGFNDARLVNN